MTKQVAFSNHKCAAGCVCVDKKCVLLPQDCDVAHCVEIMSHHDALWHMGDDFLPSAQEVLDAGPMGIQIPRQHQYWCLYAHAKLLCAETGECSDCDIVLGAMEYSRIRSGACAVTYMPDAPWYAEMLCTGKTTKSIVSGTFTLFDPSYRVTVRVTKGIPRAIACNCSA